MDKKKMFQLWRSLMIVSLIFCFTEPVSSSDQAYPIRAWVLLDYNMPYLRKMISLAAREGITDVQLCHTIGMQLSDYLEPQRNQDLRELIALAHQQGIKAHVWTHELDHVPAEFIEGGMVIADGPAFWKWMADRYRTLIDALPDVDGVVITLTETKVPIDDDNLVISSIPPTGRFVKMSQTIYDVLKPLNKQLILRTFTWIEEDFDWMLEAFRNLPEDIIIMSKVNWGDWFQHYPSNPFIGKVSPHRQIVEYDLAGQYHGDVLLPWVCADFLQEQMQYGLMQKTAGVIGRVDWSGHAWGSANEFNLIAFDALARDPYLNVGALWQKWAGEKYGIDAAPLLISALKRTNQIANLTFFTLGFKVFKSSGTLTNLSYMDGTRIMHSLFCRDVQSRWKPELIPVAEKLLKPTESVMKEAIEEKEKAVRLIDSCITEVDTAQPYLSAADYTYFSTLFRRQKLHARSWRWITEAYFRYLLYTSGGQEQGDALERSLQKVEELAGEVQLCFANRIYFLRPERMRAFVNDIRILTGSPVKWFACTNNESGRRPVFYDINDDGRQDVMVNARDHHVYGFNGGREAIWRYKTSGLRVWYPNVSDPVSADINADGEEELLAGAADGNLYVFNHRGNLVWKFKTKNGISAAPCVIFDLSEEPVTVCASLDENIYGLSPEGKLIWQTSSGAAVKRNPALSADKKSLVLAAENGNLMKVNGRGEVIWQFQLPGTLSGNPAVHKIDTQEIYSIACGSSLFLYSENGKRINKFDLEDEKEIISTGARIISGEHQQLAVVGTNKGRLYAFDLKGRNHFKTVLGRQIRTSVQPVTINGRKGMLAGVDNAIVFVDEQGNEIKRFTAANDAEIGSGLLLNKTNSELLFTGMDRKLYVLDLNFFQVN